MTTSRTNTKIAAGLCRGLIAAAVIGVSTTSTFADLNSDVSAFVGPNVVGGEWGFHLKQVDGAVLANVNENYLFYPASSIKVLQHVHAMLQVEIENNGVELDTDMTVYDSQNDACDDDHTDQPFQVQSMTDTLRDMMEQSHNQDTNAIQEFFSRAAINATIQAIPGVSSDTQLNHKFGGDCGGPQVNQNQMPLADASAIYERIAKGQVFASSETRDTFYDYMLNVGYFFDLVDQEAPEALSEETIQDFKDGISHCRKGGNWGDNIVSNLGWVYFPPPPCNDGTPREFTFGTFIDFADSVAENFNTQDIIYAMLRDQVRELLEEWEACFVCGQGGPCDVPHAGPGCDSANCCEIVCANEPFCCSVSWEVTCVNTAIELCGLGQDNDDCANAEPITGNLEGMYFNNTSNDGPSHNSICGWDTQFIKDVWFTYTPNSDGHLEIECLAGFTTWLAVYDTAQCPVTENDLIACFEVPADSVDVIYETCAIGGNTYLIRLGAANTETASGTLKVDDAAGFANDDLQPNPGGIGVANQIIADDFLLPCGGDGFDWEAINIQMVDLDGGGPPSTIQWFLYESNAAGTGPGTLLDSGATFPTQVLPIDPGGTGGVDSFFDLSFPPPLEPAGLEAGTTYWFGILVPGMLPLPTSGQNGQPAHSSMAGAWQPLAGDFSFNFGPATTAPCEGDTDGDGSVDVDDLINVILDWGSAAPSHGGDLDGNFQVNVDDLVIVILNWGTCG